MVESKMAAVGHVENLTAVLIRMSVSGLALVFVCCLFGFSFLCFFLF